MKKELSVSQVNHFLAVLVSGNGVLRRVYVRGEISNFKLQASGHIYFDLKDENSRIPCVFFANNANSLDFTPKDGMEVLVDGAVTVYERSGRVQIQVKKMEQAGLGALYQAFETMKKDLTKKGWFDKEIKKQMPDDIQKVGIVTSATGAAIHDIISVITRRSPWIKLVIYPSLVQGKQAPQSIAEGIETFNQLENVDVIIVGRGGGSFEDLWAFNEMPVIEAIYHSRLPIVSAVGHDTDITIADFAADFSAPTPSVAGELVSSDQWDIIDDLKNYKQKLIWSINLYLATQKKEKEYLKKRIWQVNPEKKVQDSRQWLDSMAERLTKAMEHVLIRDKHQLEVLTHRFFALDIHKTKNQIYVEDQSGVPITKIEDARSREILTLIFPDGQMKVQVIKERI